MSANLSTLGTVLPWQPLPDEDRRFRRITVTILVLALLLGAIMPFVPVPKQERAETEVPQRFAKLVLERREPPPPPPPPPKVEEPPKPEPVPEQVTPKPEPKPEPKPVPKPEVKPEERQAARERAKQAGVLAFRDTLADLRDEGDLGSLKQDKLNTGAGTAKQTERSLITAKAGSGSGGINTSNLSRNTGGAGELASRQTTTVTSTVAPVEEARPRGPGKKASRTDEEIQLVFDRNKSALYALYNRSLRSNPSLQGKVVLKLTIAPGGDVSAIEIVSSELKDPDLERKIELRVRRFDFGAKDVEAVTITYPIEFFPS